MGKLRLLYSSNAFWASSGYGVQGYSLLPRLANLPEFGGRDAIAQFAWYGLQGGIHSVDGFRVYPKGVDDYGNDIIQSHVQHFGANLCISLIDVWVMKDTAKKIAPALWCPWLPIDHDPVPQPFIEALRGAHLPITYSKWGQRMLADAGVENIYIPHGIEPNFFHVNPDVDKVKAFKQYLAPGCDHLTVMVAANKGYPDRKAFQVQLRAWANFAKDKPGARLYMHTEPTTMYGGLDLPALLKNLGISDKVTFPPRYDLWCGFPADFMSMIYNAADMYMGATMAEGFGIPLIEAQACGVPVVTTDFSSMPELVRWGYAVPPADMFWSPIGAWQAWPDVRGIQDTLEEYWQEWHQMGDIWPMSKRFQSQEAIHSEYSWDVIVAEQWAPVIAKLAQEAPPLGSNVLNTAPAQ